MKRSKKLELCKEFLATTGLDLQQGVLLLGGSSALMRLQRFRAAIASADGFKSGHRRELNWLKSLLGLEHAGDIDHDEFFYFSELSPDDPVVQSLCLLYEQIVDLLNDINAVPLTALPRDLDHAA